jgi:hypothetical protein
MTASFGTVFWPVTFVLGKKSNEGQGGYVIQHVIGKQTGAVDQNYWEAFRVHAGRTMPDEEVLDWRSGIKAYKIFGDLDMRLKVAYKNEIVDEALKEKANDWFWSNKHLNQTANSETIILRWIGKVYYVDDIPKADLLECFKVGNVDGAGGLPSAWDNGNHEQIIKWLDNNNKIGPIRHELTVKILGGGKTSVVSHLP